MAQTVICIGSNVASATLLIPRAVEILSSEGCEVISASDVYGMPDSPYLNQVLRMRTHMDFDSLRSLTKDVEMRLGRTRDVRALGIVPIDIDIVLFEGDVMRQADYEAPYFITGLEMI